MGRKRKGGLVPVMDVPSSSYVLESGAPPVAFRLGGSSAKLAKLVEHYSRERGERVSKSEVMRLIIHRAHQDVFGEGK